MAHLRLGRGTIRVPQQSWGRSAAKQTPTATVAGAPRAYVLPWMMSRVSGKLHEPLEYIKLPVNVLGNFLPNRHHQEASSEAIHPGTRKYQWKETCKDLKCTG